MRGGGECLSHKLHVMAHNTAHTSISNSKGKWSTEKNTRILYDTPQYGKTQNFKML